jgi:hypothetical protein
MAEIYKCGYRSNLIKAGNSFTSKILIAEEMSCTVEIDVCLSRECVEALNS